jgi:hypothetical protein
LTPQTLMRRPRSRPRAARIARFLPIVLIGVALTLLLSWALHGPDFVDRITVANPNAFDVDVDVAGSDGRLLDLKYVTAGKTAVVHDVIDQGDTWTFHFSFGGTDAGTLRVDRATLANTGWSVEIPKEVQTRLEAAGHESAPRIAR